MEEGDIKTSVGPDSRKLFWRAVGVAVQGGKLDASHRRVWTLKRRRIFLLAKMMGRGVRATTLTGEAVEWEGGTAGMVPGGMPTRQRLAYI